MGIEGELFRDALDDLKKDRGTTADTDLGVEDLQELIETYKAIIEKEAGRPFPQEPREQLDLAVRAVFDSWNTDRAVLYRRQEQIPEDLGTAVNVQAMVFGNFGADSGSGVCFTRDPASGDQGVYGDYLQNAQGEDVVAGIRNTVSLADMADIDKASHDELLGIMAKLEHHYRDMCDIEFTVERGKLWMLQTRVGKRTPEAAFRIAVHMVDEGLIDMDEALRRVNGEQLANLMFPRFDETGRAQPDRQGHERLPGRRRRQGRLRLGHRGGVGRPRRGRDPGPQGNHSRRPPRDDGRPRRADQPWRQDLPRGSGGARHGPHLRVRRRGARGGRTRRSVRGARRPDRSRGRRDLDRRVDRRGVPRRGPGHPVLGRAPLRGRGGRRTCRPGGHPADGARRRGPPDEGPHQRRHCRRRLARPPFRRRGHRSVPDRAHVPGRPPAAGREPDRGRGRRRAGGRPRRAAAAPA